MLYQILPHTDWDPDRGVPPWQRYNAIWKYIKKEVRVMRETLRYAVAYRDEEGEYTETFFATYEEAKKAVEELSAYFEVYGILR